MSTNKFLFSGNLTKDAEIAPTGGERARGRLRIAVGRHWTDGQGQRQEHTDFFNLTVWGKDAENAAKYLGKGSKIFVEGHIGTSEYEKGGERQYGIDFNVSKIDYLDTREPGQNAG